MYLVVRIEKFAERLVLIACGDDISKELGHIRLDEPLSLKQLFGRVCEVGAYDRGKQALLVCVVEFLETFGEQRVGSGKEYLAAASLLELVAQLEHRIAGCDDIVCNEDVLIADVVADILVSYRTFRDRCRARKRNICCDS